MFTSVQYNLFAVYISIVWPGQKRRVSEQYRNCPELIAHVHTVELVRKNLREKLLEEVLRGFAWSYLIGMFTTSLLNKKKQKSMNEETMSIVLSLQSQETLQNSKVYQQKNRTTQVF